MLDYPELGICVDAECRGNPGIARFQLYDLGTKQMLKSGEKFFATNNLAEFLGLINTIYYCLKHKEENIFCDSITAITWARKRAYRSNLIRNKESEATWAKINAGLKWLKTLKYDAHNCSFTDTKTNNIVFVNKWLTSEWGEIPADFGNKK